MSPSAPKPVYRSQSAATVARVELELAVGVEQQDEVVLRAVTLGEAGVRGSSPGQRAGRPRGRRGRDACGSQATRRSRRNHDSCRRANRRVAATCLGARLVSVELAASMPQHLRVAERPATPSAPSRSPRASSARDLVDQPVAPHPVRRGRAIRSSRTSRGTSRPTWTAGARVVAVGAGSPRNGRPVSSTTSSARTTRRPLRRQDRARRRRGRARRAGRAARPAPSVGELGLEPGADRRVGPGDLEAVERPRGRRGRTRRRGRAPAPRRARSSSAAPAPALVVGDAWPPRSTSRTSSRWCGTPRRSAAAAWRCRRPCRGRAAWRRR